MTDPVQQIGPSGGWKQFVADVSGPRASVQPLTGWLLTALLALIVYLTVVYAPGAFERSKQPEGADPSGVITIEMGYWTIALVAVVAFLVGIEPQLRRFVNELGARARRTLLGSVVLFVCWLPSIVIWRLPSILLSALDTLLTRRIAALVGATLRGTVLRYRRGGAVMLGAMAVGLLAPPPFGLLAAVLGIVAVVAIVRRWSWIEADRDTFLVERGTREGAQRIGFAEDLRDEALTAIICLFIFIPLILRQIQLATCAGGACAFVLEGGNLPDDILGQFLAWLGYFGAELAKAVPFVDWSEVFQVANNSPIKPRTTLGAQVVFVMRAALDLLLLAAVVQAVGIASRLREQSTAFENNRLPILEPFSEAGELSRAGAGIIPELEIRAAEQHAIKSFPRYEDTRLEELIRGSAEETAPLVLKAAVALLAR